MMQNHFSQLASHSALTLATAPTNVALVVLEISQADTHLGLRLQELGIVPGTSLKILNKAPFKGLISIQVRHSSIAIRYDLAQGITVKYL